MKLIRLLVTLALTLAVAAEETVVTTSSTAVHVQSVGSAAIVPLALVQYNPSNLDAEFTSYDAPDISPAASLVRVGVYDVAKGAWSSSTTITSAESFSKGFAPTLILSLDAQGNVLSVTCKSARIDAGQTRDFGPKVKVVKAAKGTVPELNKPIVLKEGVFEGEVPEKTMMQKYWWVGLAAIVMLMATGGEK